MANPLRLVLASRSPRRLALLSDAGYRYVIEPADIDEETYPATLLPADLAEHLAKEKAAVVAARYPNDVVLAADTVVALGKMILGKPLDEAHARRMLHQLAGSTHHVFTGVCVRHGDWQRIANAVSTVSMRPLSPDEIEQYVAGGDWRGKAGGYGIQDRDPFVTNQAGSHSNIVGLPMELTIQLLAEAGIVTGS